MNLFLVLLMIENLTSSYLVLHQRLSSLLTIVKFDGDKITHEHIYWDQASVLAHIELIDAKSLNNTADL